jgi:hypothetical protein
MERSDFRAAVFARDHGKCVVCGVDGVDAHHIIERRLWPDGGYHIDNGVTLCADCHIKAEQTILSPELLRLRAGIPSILIPDSLYVDQFYDKWGNPYIGTDLRSPGPLFHDPSVQKVLAEAGQLDSFVMYYKYPRTFHLPWSHPHSDDKVIQDLSHLRGSHDIVVTEKMDGENTSLYTNYIHARSINGSSHPSRGWVKNFHGKIGYLIPEGMRICGENLYARHSIHYIDLPTFFMGFSVWDGDRCLDWDDTVEWFELIGITSVPVLYRGPWNEALIRGLGFDSDTREGYVVRTAEAFPMREHRRAVAKYVRAGHLQTPERWERQWIPNQVTS